MRYFRNLSKSALPAAIATTILLISAPSAAQSDPCLEVFPDTLQFNLPLFAEYLVLDSQYLMVNNCGGGELAWSAFPNESWVGFSPQSGENFDSVAVWIVVSGLPDIFTPPPLGDTLILEAVLTFEAAEAANSPQYVLIQLGLYQIGPDECNILVYPTHFEYDLPIGASAGDSLIIVEADSLDAAIALSNHSNWLTLPVFFTAPRTPATTPFWISTTGMEPGIYFDTIEVHSWLFDDYTKDCGTRYVPVQLTVRDDGGEYEVAAEPSYIQVTVPPGEDRFDSLFVYETFGRSVGFVFENSKSWLTVEPLCQMPPYNTPRSLILNYNATELAPGQYVDSIIISPDLTYDSAWFPPIAVPVVMNVEEEEPQIIVIPGRFDLWLDSDDTLKICMTIYEQGGEHLPYEIETIGQSTWLQPHPNDTSTGIMPDFICFNVVTTDLEPGRYGDTLIVYNPLDCDCPYFEILIPVFLEVIEDSAEYIVAADPASFEFVTNSSEPIIDSLFVYELHDHDVVFMHENKAHWLVVNPFEMLPLTTPLKMPIVINIDTMPIGHFVDTIFIYSGWGPYYFEPVAVPVGLTVVNGEFFRGDANTDDRVNVGDAVFLINYIFKYGPPPQPFEAGDANCDGRVNVGDAVYLINFVFKSGPVPMLSCYQ